MESIGEKLRAAREARKLAVRDVVKDTNISPLYIQALEDEDFERFPSETYLIGFLRTYSEYLKLNPEEMIQSYRGYKIGESVTPLEELTRPTGQSFGSILALFAGRHKNLVLPAVIVVSAALVIWGAISLFSGNVEIGKSESLTAIKDEYNRKNPGSDIENVRSLQLHSGKGFVLVYRNEAVQFMVENKEVVFILKSIDEKSVNIEVLPGSVTEKLEINTTRALKIEGTSRDINITLKGMTTNRANLLVELAAQQEEEKAPEQKEEVVIPGGDSTSVIAQNPKSLRIVLEADFKQQSYVELYIDGTNKLRGFVPAGKRQVWEANEYMQLKLGNAGGVGLKINGRAYVFGRIGQVANKVITWRKDTQNPNLYHIVVKD